MTRDRRLVLTRILDAPIERVYAAWTDTEMLRKWFCPGPTMSVPEAELDVREGGSYRILMQNADGETWSPSGTYEKVVPNRQLIFSWRWRDSELTTRVTVDLRALSDSRTELTLTHEGFPDDATRESHYEGWDGCLTRLSETV